MAAPALPDETLLAQNDASKTTKSEATSVTSRYLQAILRCTGLHILPQLFLESQQPETPKVALHRNLIIALLHASTLFVPLGIAIALVTVNAREVYLGEVRRDTLTATQFAAKFSEILMQASIAAVVLSVIRAQVLQSEAFPLGGLLAPYSTQNVTYLWSLEFWGCITASGVAIRRRVCFALTLTLALLLTTLLGPSTAVLMIPRQQTSHLFDDLVILDPISDTFPTSIPSRENITSM